MPYGDQENKALGMALANGAALGTLLDELLAKGILTNNEIRGVLQRASNGLVGFYGTDIGLEAGRVIARVLSRFPEKRT